jgi:hypothetical protein
MSKYNHRFLLIIFVFLILFISNIQLQGSEIRVEKAITIIRSLESNIKAMEWNVTMHKSQVQNGNTIDFPFSRKSHVVYEPMKKRYHATIEGNDMAVNHNGNTMQSFFIVATSYDGNQYRVWRRTSENPKDLFNALFFGMGVVTESEADVVSIYDTKNNIARDLGVVTGLTSIVCISNKTETVSIFLSDYIKQKQTQRQKIVVREISDGLLEIVTVEKLGSIDFDVHIIYDMKKGGVIKKYQWSQTKDNVTHILREYDIQTVKNDDGDWIPLTITAIENVKPGVVNKTLVEYSNVRIYHNYLDTSRFQLDFPDGIYVEDQIRKMYYKVGNPLDEDKAISDFMTRHHLTGNVPLSKNRYFYAYILRSVLIISGIVLIVVALYLRFFKKRDK